MASPSTKEYLQRLVLCTSPEDHEEVVVTKHTLKDAVSAIKNTKRKRSDETRVAISTTLAFVSGGEVSRGRLRRKVAQKLKINQRRLTEAFRHRRRIVRDHMSENKGPWEFF